MEKKVVEKITEWLRSLPNCFVYKNHGGMYGVSGVSDICGCINGRALYIEVKDVGKKNTVTALQLDFLNKMKKARALTLVTDNLAEVKELLKNEGLL